MARANNIGLDLTNAGSGISGERKLRGNAVEVSANRREWDA